MSDKPIKFKGKVIANMHKEDKKLWRLPLDERFIGVGELGGIVGKKHMELDGIGFILEWDSEESLKKCDDPNFIRRHLVGVRSSHTYVEADTREEAIRIFNEEWEEAKVGTKKKSLWINEKYQKIKEVKPCEHRWWNTTDGHIYCGEPDIWNGNLSCPGCMLDGYDPPDEDCPLTEEES